MIHEAEVRAGDEFVSEVLRSSLKGLGIMSNSSIDTLAFIEKRKNHIRAKLEEWNVISWDGTLLNKDTNAEGIARDIFPLNDFGEKISSEFPRGIAML